MTRILTQFGSNTTAGEVADGISLSGKSVIITGAASGIGVETARALARTGAGITLAVRNTAVGAQVAADITATTGNRNIHVAKLDLADRKSITAFLTAWQQPLHILINNAGIMALPSLERTPEGWEMQLATNFLGHFALTVGLYQALASARGARIVSVSSSGNMLAPVFFDDLHFNFIPYDPFLAYGQSKTANALLAVEATRRWAADGIYSNALHPGAIPTNLQRHTGGMRTPPDRRKTPQQGAATSVLLAVSPLLEGIGGRYFEDCNEAPIVSSRTPDFGGGVAPYALDPDNAERLWKVALNLIAWEPKKACTTARS